MKKRSLTFNTVIFGLLFLQASDTNCMLKKLFGWNTKEDPKIEALMKGLRPYNLSDNVRHFKEELSRELERQTKLLEQGFSEKRLAQLIARTDFYGLLYRPGDKKDKEGYCLDERVYDGDILSNFYDESKNLKEEFNGKGFSFAGPFAYLFKEHHNAEMIKRFSSHQYVCGQISKLKKGCMKYCEGKDCGCMASMMSTIFDETPKLRPLFQGGDLARDCKVYVKLYESAGEDSVSDCEVKLKYDKEDDDDFDF